MPLYFSLSCRIKKLEIHKKVVKKMYDCIINAGFEFECSFSKKGISYENLCEDTLIYTTRGLTPNGQTQVLFKSPFTTPFRTFWIDFENNDVYMELILPEEHIYFCQCCSKYFPEKMMILAELAVSLWNSGLVEEINACSEINAGLKISKVSGDKYKWIQFAIVSEGAYKAFDKDAISAHHNVTRIADDTVFIMRNNYDICPYCHNKPEYLYSFWE